MVEESSDADGCPPARGERFRFKRVNFRGLALHSVPQANLVGDVGVDSQVYIVHPSSDRILICSLANHTPSAALM
jgi:hypothetical protein